MVIVAVGLMAAAAGGDITVYSGTIYDVVITNPAPVGANPGGEALVGFSLKIVNTTGNPAYDPAGFNGMAVSGYTGISGALHQQDAPFAQTPTTERS